MTEEPEEWEELRDALGDELPQALHVPHPDRLPPSHPRYEQVISAHERALERGDAGYLDPGTGLFVLSAQTLWDQARCCGRGCRHCPYTAIAARLRDQPSPGTW